MQAGTNICDEIGAALGRALSAEGLDGSHPAVSTLGIPPDPAHGDFSSNIALQLAKSARRKPIEIAEAIANRFDGPASASVAPPGFLNFHVRPERLRENLIELGAETWSRSSAGSGTRINLEYVSANPTGPLHVGHGRGAVIGDVTARLLSHSGFEVTREYYLNDIGKQIEDLGQSVLAAARRASGEDDGGYRETYRTDEVAQAYLAAGGTAPASDPAKVRAAAAFAQERILGDILGLLERLGISFDVVTRESSLQDEIPSLVEELRGRGLLYDALEPEGAEERVRREGSKAAKHADGMEGGTFLRTSRFGDELDRIILRAGGAPTYFTSDIAYHRQKIRRGFQSLINVWGADHGGHVRRLEAALRSLDLPADRLKVILCQMVRLVRNGVEVKMSKRAGNVVLLEDLVDEVGPDAVRFFFLTRSSNSQFDFDLDLAVKKSSDNPVFYCQYAHARTNQLLVKGREAGLTPSLAAADRLAADTETALLRKLIAVPELLRTAAQRLEPHRVVEMAMSLAQSFHRYQTAGKEDDRLRIVRSDQPEISAARLALVEGVGRAFRVLFGIMGISAPEKM